ncbi:MAG: hypothetical protein JJV98_01675 [Desulfosarcina sp.]|nr:hypothetical protein [Desulfobacterales bacterium]
MATPVLYTPLLATNPVGWLVFGAAGYLTYRIGKKVGLKSEENAQRENLADRAVKGVMKSAYKAKIKVDASLGKTREKYATMWNEVQAETKGTS